MWENDRIHVCLYRIENTTKNQVERKKKLRLENVIYLFTVILEIYVENCPTAIGSSNTSTDPIFMDAIKSNAFCCQSILSVWIVSRLRPALLYIFCESFFFLFSFKLILTVNCKVYIGHCLYARYAIQVINNNSHVDNKRYNQFSNCIWFPMNKNFFAELNPLRYQVCCYR